jgi:predicted RNA-binding protein associated with RNAse of E/G family
MSQTCPLVHIHYLRPPGRLEVFVQHLLLDAENVKITYARDIHFDPPLVVEGKVVLETGSDVVWFTFPDAWHDIGRFHRADGSFTGTYANILTPPRFNPDRTWETTDLFLDLWIPAGDRGVRVLDAEQFEEAIAQEWLDPDTAERARREVDRLVSLAGLGEWPPEVVGEWDRGRALGVLEECGA